MLNLFENVTKMSTFFTWALTNVWKMLEKCQINVEFRLKQAEMSQKCAKNVQFFQHFSHFLKELQAKQVKIGPKALHMQVFPLKKRSQAVPTLMLEKCQISCISATWAQTRMFEKCQIYLAMLEKCSKNVRKMKEMLHF